MSTTRFVVWSNVKEITVLLLIVFLIRTFGFGLYHVPTGSMETQVLVGERFFADLLTPFFSKIQRGEVIVLKEPVYKFSENQLVRLFQFYVWGPANWTKRVIGIPGDTVRGAIEDGKPVVYVNDKKLDEPYINQYPLVHLWLKDPLEIQAYVRRGGNARDFISSSKSFDPSRSPEQQPFYRMKADRIIMDGTHEAMIYPGTPIYPAADAPQLISGKNYWSSSDIFNVKLGENQYWLMGDNRLGSTDCRFFGPIDGRLIFGRIKYRIWSLDSDSAWPILDLIRHPIDFWSRVRWSRLFKRVR